ncbi:MAG: hypothetical protein H6842_02640 [Rhodospirillaceae bacterium]|nr:hypothetical protein [Rhodospirillaceae bacterium]
MLKAALPRLFGRPATPGIRPWRTSASGKATEAVLGAVHRSFHTGSGPDLRLGKGDGKRLASDISEYRDLLHRLCAIPHLRFRTFRAVAGEEGTPDGPWAVLRHDVDGDIETALHMAECEAEHGIRASYYLHYGSRYYGDYWVRGRDGSVRRDLFLRHEGMADLYRRIEALGHEVGIHVNPYGVPEVKGMDGVQAMRVETAWLRAQRLAITGCSGHSSKGVFRIDPMCIFKEYEDLPRYDRGPDEDTRIHAGRLSLDDLDLAYMADFFYWRGETLIWSVRSQERAAPFRPGQGAVGPVVSFRAMVDDIAGRVRSGNWPDLMAIHVHPLSFGARLAESRNDETALRARAPSLPQAAVPKRYVPGAPHLLRARSATGVQIELPVVPNAIGVIDFSWQAAPIAGRPRVLLVGDETFDTPLCGVAGRVGGWLRDAAATDGLPAADARTLAVAGAGTADYEGYLDLLNGVPPFDAAVVVVGRHLIGDASACGTAMAVARRIADVAVRNGGLASLLIVDAGCGLVSALGDAALARALALEAGAQGLDTPFLSDVIGPGGPGRGAYCDAEDCRRIARWIAARLDGIGNR